MWPTGITEVETQSLSGAAPVTPEHTKWQVPSPPSLFPFLVPATLKDFQAVFVALACLGLKDFQEAIRLGKWGRHYVHYELRLAFSDWAASPGEAVSTLPGSYRPRASNKSRPGNPISH